MSIQYMTLASLQSRAKVYLIREDEALHVPIVQVHTNNKTLFTKKVQKFLVVRVRFKPEKLGFSCVSKKGGIWGVLMALLLFSHQ